MSPSLKGWILLVVLSASFKKKISNVIGSASARVEDTWRDFEDSCEDTSCVSCKRGFYGEGSCNRTCNQHCMLGYCSYSTGACKYGCVDTNRNSLTSPWYGPSCSQRCHSNCLLGRCFRNGTCYLGCQNGTYGDTCEDACPENCFQNCKRKGGECEDGCQSGFYGKYCDMTCSVNCLGGRCHQNGKCHNCTEGFQGDTCYNKCPKHCKSCEQYGDNCTSCADGQYGHKCIVCDKCQSKCQFSDGKCTDGCKDGYHGDYCSVSCNIGCQPLVCDQSTGECSSGCIPTMYGTSCDQTCSSNCMESQCQNRPVLECSIGCIAGFWGKYCEHLCDKDCLRCTRSSGLCMECKRNTYGHHCEKNCSMNCFDRKCNNNTGACVSGCISGYHGNNCSLKCSKRCNICHQKSGTCSKCVAGWIGETCEGYTKTVVVYTLMSLLPVSVVLTVILLIVKCRPHRGRGKSSMGCCGCGCCKNTQPTNYSFEIRPRPASYSYGEPDYLDTGNETISLYLTGARDDVIPEIGSQGNDVPGTVSCSTTDLDNMTVTSHSRLLASSVAHTSPSSGDAWDHKSIPTQCNSRSFSDYVHRVKGQSGFYKQFKGLPGGELAACFVGKTTTNRRKNRYGNILPYDHSRVKLVCGDCQGGKDYINASYINGYGKPCFFIASQGPLQDTIPEFWNMVLQTRAPTIVMLTNLHENGKVMCNQYWPDLECVHQYGDLQVQTVTEMVLADYTIRAFSISQKGRNEVRSLVHYHYTAWPDYSQPVDTKSFLNFHTEVKRTCGAGPLVVHCSTGVGRAGTFIALDYLLDQATAEGVVDVFECVKRLRYQRMNMIHHQGEYELLHNLLVLALHSSGPLTEDNPVCQDVK
ncbi:uncharacterized protein [Haliotis asinina]|uniref:uncharacterized protein n=1 Tax=Haliotis asinina TaxID=109174 RepID=UPI00353225FD